MDPSSLTYPPSRLSGGASERNRYGLAVVWSLGPRPSRVRKRVSSQSDSDMSDQMRSCGGWPSGVGLRSGFCTCPRPHALRPLPANPLFPDPLARVAQRPPSLPATVAMASQSESRDVLKLTLASASVVWYVILWTIGLIGCISA